MLLLSFILLGALAALVIFGLDLSWNNVTLPSRNEVVFEKKNKNYGAFQIRSHYNNTLVISLIITALGTVAVCIAPMFFKLTAEPSGKIVPVDEPWQLLKPIVLPATVTSGSKTISESKPAGKIETTPEVVKDHPTATPSPTPDPGTGSSDPGTTPAGTIPVEPGNSGHGAATGAQKVETYVDEWPEFIGGTDELMKYLSANIQYPVSEMENGIQGTIVLTFVIDQYGNIRDVKELKGVKGGPNLAKEAIRVVKSMPRWKPGRIHNQPVPVQFNLPVRFMLR